MLILSVQTFKMAALLHHFKKLIANYQHSKLIAVVLLLFLLASSIPHANYKPESAEYPLQHIEN
ncbi:hypothetical protein ACFOEE_15720 [Pseudoalteromonas fenneropenaei]|uniref:Uncharacterized protein n=1 Tax=Pseudoalteromonas fenneropenaei TaxID=1737459 RepID=A0ABV7CN41_9GAMM